MSRTKTNKDRREIVVAADVAVVHVAVVLDVMDVVVVDVVVIFDVTVLHCY